MAAGVSTRVTRAGNPAATCAPLGGTRVARPGADERGTPVQHATPNRPTSTPPRKVLHVLRIARRAALVAALATAFAPLAIATSASAATSPTTIENQVMSLINKQRVAKGCTALRT